MKVDKKTLENIAHLSRLAFDEKNTEKMLGDLNRILDWIDMLNEIDTTHVLPLAQMSEEVNNLRPDVLKEALSRKDGLKNAPKKDSDYFRVPKVLE